MEMKEGMTAGINSMLMRMREDPRGVYGCIGGVSVRVGDKAHNSYRGTRETPVTLENGGIETGQLLTEGKSENKETQVKER
ncbi:hypothetical protein EYF80_014822 [Liparis tanakae]|uniref:Uncharacterized protein n=1 Tax=Liparis tanakae TaxID=230148 RepID=A0A4Z2IC40_9TELE|nr:hypothetical protein EYF80_014822 [Liparis tanakae]